MNGQFRTNFLHSSLGCPVCTSPRTKVRFFLKDGGVVHRCRHCTVEFLYPQPDEAQLKQLYSESYYAAWGLSGQLENESTRAMKTATFRLRLALIRRFLPGLAGVRGGRQDSRRDGPLTGLRGGPWNIGSDAALGEGARYGGEDRHGGERKTMPAGTSVGTAPRILDVGCATGYFLQLAVTEGFQPFGVEYSSYAAARARLALGAGAIFQGTLEEAVFPKGSFAAIAMSDLLEHVSEPVTTLLHAESLLERDGVLLIMTPDTGSLSHAIMSRRWTHYKPEHLFYFNRRSLAEVAKRANLRIVYLERSKKALNLAYLHTQFAVYRHWLLSPLVNFLHRLAPKKLRTRNFYLSIGEMVAILKKNA